jgi:hypothetical protein
MIPEGQLSAHLGRLSDRLGRLLERATERPCKARFESFGLNDERQE